LAGSSGNKGAVSAKFKFNDTLLHFINCHLASGQKKVGERMQDMADIHRKVGESHNEVRFLFGDFNFRVDLDKDTIKY